MNLITTTCYYCVEYTSARLTFILTPHDKCVIILPDDFFREGDMT